MPAELRRLSRDEAHNLKRGDRVAVRYFDPNGPDRDRDTNMTTEHGVVVAVDETKRPHERDVLVRLPSTWGHDRVLDYFGTDLYVEERS